MQERKRSLIRWFVDLQALRDYVIIYPVSRYPLNILPHTSSKLFRISQMQIAPDQFCYDILTERY